MNVRDYKPTVWYIFEKHWRVILIPQIFLFFKLLPVHQTPWLSFHFIWSKNYVLVIRFFGSLPDRVLLMIAAGSVHNHPGWLGLWPLAEPDNSELSDFYPPLNSDKERARERERELIKKEEGADQRNTVWRRGWGEKWRGRRRGGTDEGGRGGSHCATHPGGTDIIWERQASGRGKAMKGEGGGKERNKEEWNIASDVLQKHLTFTWFSWVRARQLESGKGHQSSLCAAGMSPVCQVLSVFIRAERSL